MLFADGFQPQVVAARTGTFYGQPMIAGHMYVIRGVPRATGRRVAEPPGPGWPSPWP
ncbi:MAG: hypothetical protein ACRDPO_30675 [Streptosporangiaceae bacterium]